LFVFGLDDDDDDNDDDFTDVIQLPWALTTTILMAVASVACVTPAIVVARSIHTVG